MNWLSRFSEKPMRYSNLLILLVNLAVLTPQAIAQYAGWQHSRSLFILTTPEGANLPASAMEKDFPLLVRLHKDFFDFTQAKAQGEDIRFSTSDGAPLAYQVEQWDAAGGTASIWVRIPDIKGNARQEIRLHWGKADTASESSGAAVFNESNGYLSVWHMNEAVKDEVGSVESKDVGTTLAEGMIGAARHLAGKQGIFGGDKITSYPTGALAHTSEAWFRPEKPNITVLAWGNEQAQAPLLQYGGGLAKNFAKRPMKSHGEARRNQNVVPNSNRTLRFSIALMQAGPDIGRGKERALCIFASNALVPMPTSRSSKAFASRARCISGS